MKLKILVEKALNEMAIINPIKCKQITIQVEVEQRNEGDIPHLHVYHDKTRNPKKCSYVRLDEVGYSKHHEEIRLPKKLKDQFIQVMNDICPNTYIEDFDGNIYKATGYQHAVRVWADTFEDGSLEKFQLDENGLIKQLDYSNL